MRFPKWLCRACNPIPRDLVLIDGVHGFPMPLVDLYVTADKLRVGGVLVIDDTHLCSRGRLVDVLKSDSGWSAIGQIAGFVHRLRKGG